MLHLVDSVRSVQGFISIGTQFGQLDLDLIKLFIQVVERLLALRVLLAHVLQLLARVRHDNDCDSNFPGKFG